MSRPQPLSRSAADIEQDPITLQVIRHELVAVPNQIEKNIERTAFSPLVQEYKDYSVGFVDPSGRLVAQSRGSLPIFVANALGAAVREGLQIHGIGSLADGDIIISNTAAVLGEHLNNVVTYTPVRVAGTLAGFFAVLVHWIDLAGLLALRVATATQGCPRAAARYGVRNLGLLIGRRARIQGFTVFDIASRHPEARHWLTTQHKAGRLRQRVHVIEDLGRAPEGLSILFRDANIGKLAVQVAAPPPS